MKTTDSKMTPITIDAAVLEKVKTALKYISEFTGGHRIEQAANEALTLLESAQSQPGVGDEARKAALEWFDGMIKRMDTQVPFNAESLMHIVKIRAALSAPAVQEWQPIESAPRDETSVIVTNGEAVGEAKFHEHAGWFWAQTHPTDATDGAVYGATHWQHLPPPPRTVADKTQGEGL